MFRRLVISSFLILALGFAVAPRVVLAADASPDKLKKVESELQRQKQQAAALEEESKETSGNLQNLQQKLVDATASLEGKEEEQQQIEERLSGIEKEIAEKNAAYDKNRRELSVLVDVLIRLGQQPPETYFLQAGL